MMVRTTDMGNGTYHHEIEPHDFANAVMYYIHEASAGFRALGRSLGSLTHVFDGLPRQHLDWDSDQGERRMRPIRPDDV